MVLTVNKPDELWCKKIYSMDRVSWLKPLHRQCEPSHKCDPWYELKQFRKYNAKNFIFGCLNINSLRNKYVSMCDIFNDNLIIFFIMCESFLIGNFKCEWYSVYRKDSEIYLSHNKYNPRQPGYTFTASLKYISKSDYETYTLTAWLKTWSARQAASSLFILKGILQ